jgi:predicted dinucleotide-binding enzyme
MTDSTGEQNTRSTTAIIGVGNIGATLARHLTHGGEAVVLSANDTTHAEALADELGALARAASVEEAIGSADVVILALWLDAIKGLIPNIAHLLHGKVIVDPSNPIAFDAQGQISRTLPESQSAGSVVAAMLPDDAHFVKAFGTLAAEALAAGASRKPRPAVLFYATDDPLAAETVERLIRAAGFEPMKAGRLADAGRIEAPGGDLHQFAFNGDLVDHDVARVAVSKEPTANGTG